MRNNESEVESYVKSKIKGKDLALEEMRDKNFDDNRRYIQIDSIEGRILEIIIKLSNAKKVVEVGTLAGYSTLWMANAIPSDGKVYTIEKNHAHAEIARENFKGRSNIELIVGDAEEELQYLADYAPFDVLFLDADKKKYSRYLEWGLNNLRQGGVIVADNTLSFGDIMVFDDNDSPLRKAVDEFNDKISDPKYYCSIILPTKNGFTIAVKK